MALGLAAPVALGLAPVALALAPVALGLAAPEALGLAPVAPGLAAVAPGLAAPVAPGLATPEVLGLAAPEVLGLAAPVAPASALSSQFPRAWRDRGTSVAFAWALSSWDYRRLNLQLERIFPSHRILDKRTERPCLQNRTHVGTICTETSASLAPFRARLPISRKHLPWYTLCSHPGVRPIRGRRRFRRLVRWRDADCFRIVLRGAPTGSNYAARRPRPGE